MATDVNFGTQQYFNFDPRAIPGCVLWLDGSDPTYSTPPANGAAVSTWFDKSGRSNNATGYNTPTYASNAINTVGAISLASGKHFRATPASFLTSNSMTTFAVATTTATLPRSGSDQRLVSFSTNSTTRDYDNTASVIALFNQTTSSTIGTYRNGWVASNAIAQNTPFMAVSLYDGANGFLFFNGSAGSFTGTASSGNFNVGAYGIGNAANNTTEYWNGFVGEVITYNRNLSSDERQTVEGYLAWKWRLTANLPTSHPFKRNSPAMRLFQPIDVLACQLWLDAADRSAFTLSGTSVTAWNDKSGNGRNAANQNTAGVLVDNVQNRLSVLRLAGVNNYAITYPSFPNAAYTVFTLQYLSTTTGYGRFLQNDNNPAGSQPGLFIGVGPNGTSIATFTGPGTGWNDIDANSPAITNLATWRIVTTWVSGSTLTPYVDGTAQTNKVGTTRAFSNLNIGSYPNSPPIQGWNGDAGEIILYNSALTTSQRQQVEGYLAWKWGLRASIPTTHPFYNFPPATALFVPPLISNCALWFDAADTTAITTTGTTQVTGWINKGSIVTTATPTTGTSTTGNTFNGLNYINIPVGSEMRFTAAINTQARSWFFVARATTAFTANPQFWGPVNATANGRDGLVVYSDTSIFLLYNGPNGIDVNVSGYIGNPFNRVGLYALVNSATAALNVVTDNGTSVALANSVAAGSFNTGSAQVIIGTAGYARGNDIMEIILYYGDVTQSQRQRVEGYLAWKWGLQTNLPTTHPYYKFRP